MMRRPPVEPPPLPPSPHDGHEVTAEGVAAVSGGVVIRARCSCGEPLMSSLLPLFTSTGRVYR